MSHPDPSKEYNDDYDFDDGRPNLKGHEECDLCDGQGVSWNNADPTSGQWIECPAEKASK